MVEMTQARSESLCNPWAPDSLRLHKHVIEGPCCIVHPGDNAACSRAVRPLLPTHKNRRRWRLFLTCCRGLRRVAETSLERRLSAWTRPLSVWLSPNHESVSRPALWAELYDTNRGAGIISLLHLTAGFSGEAQVHGNRRRSSR